jgi:hypothetical protein
MAPILLVNALWPYTLWHPDAVSGSHPPHLLFAEKRASEAAMSESDPGLDILIGLF